MELERYFLPQPRNHCEVVQVVCLYMLLNIRIRVNGPRNVCQWRLRELDDWMPKINLVGLCQDDYMKSFGLSCEDAQDNNYRRLRIKRTTQLANIGLPKNASCVWARGGGL